MVSFLADPYGSQFVEFIHFHLGTSPAHFRPFPNSFQLSGYLTPLPKHFWHVSLKEHQLTIPLVISFKLLNFTNQHLATFGGLTSCF